MEWELIRLTVEDSREMAGEHFAGGFVVDRRATTNAESLASTNQRVLLGLQSCHNCLMKAASIMQAEVQSLSATCTDQLAFESFLDTSADDVGCLTREQSVDELIMPQVTGDHFVSQWMS